MSDTIQDPFLSNKCTQEIENILTEIKNVRLRYYRNKIICNAIANCELDSDLREKVDGICMAHKLESSMSLNATSLESNSIRLLGLTELSADQLTCGKAVGKAVDHKIIKQHSEVVKALGPLNELNLNGTVSKYVILQDFLNKLHFQQQSYVNNLITISNILDTLVKNRTENVPKFCELKLVDSSLKEKMYDLRRQILDNRTREKIFTELPTSLEAYQNVISDIFEAQHEYKRDIKDLELLKEKYKQVRCSEFDEVLKGYIQYKKALKSLKRYTDLNSIY